MSAEQKFEEMIKAGWDVLVRDFDENATMKWRKQACKFLTEMLGSDHPYTLNLCDKALKAVEMSDLSGIGVLCAAKESQFHGSLPVGRSVTL